MTRYFNDIVSKETGLSPAVAAIKSLLQYIKKNKFGTVTELREKLINAIDTLTKTDSSAISVKSGCEMLLRFITLTALDAGVSFDRIEKEHVPSLAFISCFFFCVRLA